ncbi:MAG TPA: hypothetical protein VM165_22265, partial [Planctomycetaceae bacterium]|nr:hypothetical protein [Planctomycetaceae bacterium]
MLRRHWLQELRQRLFERPPRVRQRRTAAAARVCTICSLELRELLSVVPVDPEFRVNTYTTGVQSGAAVAVDGDGDFVVVWTSNGQDGSSVGVYAQR